MTSHMFHQYYLQRFHYNQCFLMTFTFQNKLFKNFRIKKRLQFGQALYMAGSIAQIGSWDICRALRLTWNQKDIWTATVQLGTTLPSQFQYKYFISFWEDPRPSSIQWEDGNHNRIIYPNLKNLSDITDDKWNMQKICLNLMVPQNQDVYNNYSVIGNHIQLGNWKSRVPLTRKKQTFRDLCSQIDTDNDGFEKYNVYLHAFQIYRGRQKFRYYYLRQASYLCEPERHPGRLFILGKQNSHHPDFYKTVYNNGKTQLYEKCNFRLLNFSQITPKLYLGAYPKSLQDIKTLKKEGINAIFSIQTQDDFLRHQVSEQNFKQICSNEGIEIHTCSIKDMDKKEFIEKAEGALSILKKWSNLNLTIYVHCSAGIYRSPQIMILHLIQSLNYNLQKAIELVKEKHPYANPNIELVINASERLRSQKVINSEHLSSQQSSGILKSPIFQDFKGQDSDIFEYH